MGLYGFTNTAAHRRLASLQKCLKRTIICLYPVVFETVTFHTFSAVSKCVFLRGNFLTSTSFLNSLKKFGSCTIGLDVFLLSENLFEENCSC